MPTSFESLTITVLIFPGLVGYLVFSRIYNKTIKDNFEKAAWIAFFAIAANLIFSFWDNSVIANYKKDKIDIVKYLQSTLMSLSAISLALSIMCSIILNIGCVANFLRKYGLTDRESSQSIIAQVICSNPHKYMKIRFRSGGYILGYPMYFSKDGNQDCLYLIKASRRPPRVGVETQAPQYEVDGPGILIVNFDDIQSIEILDGIF